MAEFIIIVVVFVWIARWTREFTYRWLFSRTRDVGIRNSLSIFCQYAVVLIGIMVALKMLGIDVRGLTYIFTGLAFGLGFGLRDLATNVVGGVAVLVERKIRRGDFVTIGQFEGEVTHIGVRSITLSSWDHMDVVIPSAEIFTKAFSNWTLQDNIVRTVITVKLLRTDNPEVIREAVMAELTRNPEILEDPAPTVFMFAMADSLVELQIRYYINLQASSRPKVRSDVLFSLWSRFKILGVEPPNEQKDIYIKQLPKAPKPLL